MTFPSPGADWPKIDAYLKSLGIRINNPLTDPQGYGETEGGNHVAKSEHYQHRARDYPVSKCDAPAIAKALEHFARGPNAVIDELFYSGTRTWYDSGTYFVPAADAIEYKNHFTHCHAGIKRGASLPTGPTPPKPTPVPPKPPTPPPHQEDRIVYVTYSPEDTSKARWLTDDLTRRWIETQIELTFFVNKYGAEKPTPIGILAKVPTVGPTP